MKNKFLILWMLSSVLLAACDEKLTPYSEETCWLGFDMKNSADTLVFRTFIYSEPQAETDTVWIPLKTIGKVVDYDRPVKLVQLPVKDSCAVSGKHFVAFDDAALHSCYMIPAGKTRAQIPVVLKRDVSLKEDKVLIEIAVGENEYFFPSFVSPKRIYVWVTDQLERPSFWTTAEGATLNTKIGIYDPVLHQFLIDATGEKWDDEYIASLGLTKGYLNTSWGPTMTYWDDLGPNYDANYLNYLVSRLQEALKQENAARANRGEEPLKRSDGTELKIGK